VSTNFGAQLAPKSASTHAQTPAALIDG
jgi:hypothetical protein